MQITTDIVTILLSILGSAIVVGVSWGNNQAGHAALREKVQELRQEIEEIRQNKERDSGKYVTVDVFNSVIAPIHNQLSSIQADIKDLIRVITKNQAQGHRRD